jgi:hypothetical protein
MKNHIEHSITLSEDSKFKSLYQWHLRESDDGNSQHRQDQIPWVWTQYFTLADLACTTSFTLGGPLATDKESTAPEVKEREVISATLLPYELRDRQALHDSTTYSMFGTDRAIDNFSLAIHQASDGMPERCSAWGIVSYTHDFDFREVTEDDCLGFYLVLSKERFARIARMIAENSISGGTVRLGAVDGFYSEWSPAISTPHIKVLTSEEKVQPVDLPEGCLTVPPRLGRVGEFELYLMDEHKFSLPTVTSFEHGLGDDSPASVAISQETASQSVTVIDAKNLAVIKSVRIAVWIIAAVLILLLFK